MSDKKMTNMMDNDNDAMAADSAVNPGSPTSLGALLAEENAMNQPTTKSLPSFLEFMFIEEATRASRQAMIMALNILRQQLLLWRRNSQRTSNHQQRRLLSIWLKWRRRFFRIAHHVLNTYGQEILALLVYLLERQCLLTNQATLSESLYGGRRVQLGQHDDDNDDKVDETKANQQPSTHPNRPRRQRRRVLLPADRRNLVRFALWLSLGPYLADRLAKMYRQYQQELSLQQQDESSSSRSMNNSTQANRISIFWKQWFVRIYPLCSSVWQLWLLWYKWQYLVGRSVYFDPMSRFLQLVVVRRSGDSTTTPLSQLSTTGSTTTTAADSAMTTPSNKDNNISHHPPHLGSNTKETTLVPQLVTCVLSSTLLIGWLSQWRSEWNQRNLNRRRDNQNHSNTNTTNATAAHEGWSLTSRTIPPPPPPPRDVVLTTSHLRHRRPGHCPICHQPYLHPAACTTSGQVFCYKCWKQYYGRQQQQQHPASVTAGHLHESGLVRLYESYHPSQPTASNHSTILNNRGGTGDGTTK